MAIVLTVAAAAKNIKKESLQLSAGNNGDDQLTVTVDTVSGSYRPALDAAVTLAEGSDTLFGGSVTGIREFGLGTAVGKWSSEITARDNKAKASRRYFTGGAIPAGTLKAALTALVAYIDGVTLDAGQVDGPDLEDLEYPVTKVNGVLDELSTITGYIWTITTANKLKAYEPGTDAAPFNIAAGDGNVIGDVTVEVTRGPEYANYVFLVGGLVESIASDAGEISSYGQYELAVEASEDLDQAAADALTAAVLAKGLVTRKTVTYHTRRTGLFRGMTQTINLPVRNINNTFLIVGLEWFQFGTTGQLERIVTAIEGSVSLDGWLQGYREWIGGGSGVVAASAISAGAANRRFAYFLGGNGVETVSNTDGTTGKPIQENAPGVLINTVARGTLSLTVTTRLKTVDAGGGVKAKVWDNTLSSYCAGESATITSTSLQLATFTATLNAGSHEYHLHLVPTVANKEVMGVGGYGE